LLIRLGDGKEIFGDGFFTMGIRTQPPAPPGLATASTVKGVFKAAASM
jgi:hypothetical protein